MSVPMTVSSPEGGGCLECRVCLTKIGPKEKSVDIFQPWKPPGNYDETTVAAEMTRLANIEIAKIEGYPQNICASCLRKLQWSLELVKSIRSSNEILLSRLSETQSLEETWPKPIQVEKSLNKEVLRNSIDVEIKQELVSDDDCDVEMDDNDRLEDLAMDVKSEPEETDPLPIQVTVNGTIPLDQHDKIPSLTNGCEVYENEEYLEASAVSTIKEEPLSEEEVPSDLSLECLLCTKDFNTVSGLKAHVLAHHNYKSVKRKADGSVSPMQKQPSDRPTYVCGICKRSNFECVCSMKKLSTYKKCFMPECKNNTKDTPDRTFFGMPYRNQTEWCEVAGVNPTKRRMYICDAHINLEEDLENYMYWKLTKEKGTRPRLKPSLPGVLKIWQSRNSELESQLRRKSPTGFTTSTDLKVHEVCHGKFTCFACNAKYDTFDEVTRHRRRCKVKNIVAKPKTLTDILKQRVAQKQSVEDIEEGKQLIECSQCDMSFKTVFHYKIHNSKHHADIEFGTSEKQDDQDSDNDKIEIEIDLKKEINKVAEVKTEIKKDVIDASNMEQEMRETLSEDSEKIKKEKAEADYKKIETELESIFENTYELPRINILMESEDDESDTPNFEKDDVKKDVEKTVEEILSNKYILQTREYTTKNLSESNKTFTSEINSAGPNKEKVDRNLKESKTIETMENVEIESKQISKILNINKNRSARSSVKDTSMEVDVIDSNEGVSKQDDHSSNGIPRVTEVAAFIVNTEKKQFFKNGAANGIENSV